MSEFSIFARSISVSEGIEKAVAQLAKDDGDVFGNLTIESIAEVPDEPRVHVVIKDNQNDAIKGIMTLTLYKDEAVELAKVLLMMFDYESKK